MSILTALAPMYKTLYPGDTAMNAALRKRPAFGLLPKDTGFVGDGAKVPITYALSPSVGPSIAKAITNAGVNKSKAWTITRANLYGVFTLPGKDLLALKKGDGGFVDGFKEQTDGINAHMGQVIERGLFGNSGGSLGVIDTIGNGDATNDLITLATADDAINFYEGMVLVASANDGTGSGHSLRDSGDEITVTKVDHDAGTVQVAENSSSVISGLQSGDHLFHSQTSSEFPQSSMTGFGGWLPLTAPASGDSFFGVDRSVNPTFLAGHRRNDTGSSILDNIHDLCSDIARTSMSSGDKVCFLSHTNVAKVCKELEGTVERAIAKASATAEVFYNAVNVNTAVGPVKIISSPSCPTNRGYVVDPSTWKLMGLGQMPHLVTDDGKGADRQSNADGIEVRHRAFLNPFCKMPSENGVFAI